MQGPDHMGSSMRSSTVADHARNSPSQFRRPIRFAQHKARVRGRDRCTGKARGQQNGSFWISALNYLAELDPVHPSRHYDVRKYQIKFLFLQLLERVVAISYARGLITQLLKHFGNDHTNVVVILYNEYAARAL